MLMLQPLKAAISLQGKQNLNQAPEKNDKRSPRSIELMQVHIVFEEGGRKRIISR
jgi:hypothetical protein